MKQIFIFSDTHNNIGYAIDVLNRADRVDAIIHAGDYARDAESIQTLFSQIPVYSVRGNCDMVSQAPLELTVIIDGVKVFITHGHLYNVKYESSLRTLKDKGRDAGADLVVFGHTHKPFVDYEGEMTVVNPGSAGYGEQYAIATVESGEIRIRTFG